MEQNEKLTEFLLDNLNNRYYLQLQRTLLANGSAWILDYFFSHS